MGEKMASRNRSGAKSRNRIREEILEDWADVRQWIEELQSEWVERQEAASAQSNTEKFMQLNNQKSSGK